MVKGLGQEFSGVGEVTWLAQPGEEEESEGQLHCSLQLSQGGQKRARCRSFLFERKWNEAASGQVQLGGRKNFFSEKKVGN